MSLTVCCVVYNEEKHFNLIEQNIVLLAKFHPEIKVLLIDNGSSDETNVFLQRMSQKYRSGMLTRRQNNLAEARQQAVVASQTPWIGFFDADCLLFDSWPRHVLKRIDELDTKVAAVGGPWSIGGAWSYAYRSLFSTFLGHFGMDYLKKAKEPQMKSVLHLPTANIVYNKQALLSVGGFSYLYKRVGEDLDMSYRLMEKGYTLLFDSQMGILHFLPESLHQWCRKMYSYGRARAKVSFKFKKQLSYACILPFLFILFWAGALISVQPFAAVFLLSYLLVCGAVSVYCSRLKSALLVFKLMVLTHFFYGLGLTMGLLQEAFVLMRKYVQQKNKESKKFPPEKGLDDFPVKI